MKSMRNLLNRQIDKINQKGRYEETVRQALNFPPVKAFIDSHQDEIDQAMIEASISKFNEFRREYEAYQAGQATVNPGFKPELFINGSYIDVAYKPTQEYFDQKDCLHKASLLSNATMSRDVRQASLEDFHTNTASRQSLMVAVLDFMEAYQASPMTSQGLYIYGPFGVGKTFILGAMANQLVELDHSVNMVHWPTFAIEVKQSIGTSKTGDMIYDLKKADVLIIDDIGAEPNTVWIRDEVLNSILEYRMKEYLATFFTSNFSMEELEHHLTYSRDGGQETIKAKRIMERIKFLAKEIILDGQSLRGINRR